MEIIPTFAPSYNEKNMNKSSKSLPRKVKETVSLQQDGSVIIPIAFAVARYGGSPAPEKENGKNKNGERGGGITRTELAIIDAVLHKIQSLVRKQIDMKAKGEQPNRQLMLQFEKAAGKITDKSQSEITDVGSYEWKFPLRDLGIAPRHYQEAFDVVMKMGDINVEWEFDDEEHGRSTAKRQLFQPAALGAVRRWNDPKAHTNAKGEVAPVPPNTPNNLYHWEYTGKPAVGISMSGIVAERLFDPYRYGHYLDVTLDFKCKYSIRLYWFLSLYWSRGFTHFDFSWHALRTTLGIDQSTKGGKNNIYEVPGGDTGRIDAPDADDIEEGVYPKPSLFIKRVLDPIKEDFLRMAPHPDSDNAKAPRVEYNLDWEMTKHRVYKNGTVVEAADRIIITLNVSSLGRQIQDGRDINAQQRQVMQKMTADLCQTEQAAKQFARLAAGHLQRLEDKVDYLIDDITRRNPNWGLCVKLAELDQTREADLTNATTDTRRHNIEKRYAEETRKLIHAYAKKSLENFCHQELPAMSTAKAEDAVAVEIKEQTGETASDADDIMKIWG